MPPARHGDRVSATFERQELDAKTLNWGPDNLQATAQACAEGCIADAQCSVWAWCALEQGCGGGELGKQKACWFKARDDLTTLKFSASFVSEGVRWTSGIVASSQQVAAVKKEAASQELSERDRIQALRDNATLPMVFLDVEIKGKPVGRMEFVLFTHTSPVAAENFRALCTGEREGNTLKGAYFYRIIDRFIDQSGSNTGSVYRSLFKDEPGALAWKHDRPGLLSLANGGPNTNGGHFSVVVAASPHLNGHYGVFGEVVSGWDVMYRINAVAIGKPDSTAGREEGVLITQAGQLRYGTASAALQGVYPATALKLVKKPDELWSQA